MQNVKYKSLLVALLIAGFSVILYVLLNNNAVDEEHSGVKQIALVESGSSPAVEKTQNANSGFSGLESESASSVPQVPKDVFADPVIAAKAKEWMASRGWIDVFGSEIKDDYKTYSRDVLMQLAENGDIHALHLLALRASKEEGSRLLHKAAVYGSTFALSNITTSLMVHTEVKKDSPEESRKQLSREVLAYLQVAKMRGDVIASFNFEPPEERYNVKLDTADHEKISQRSQEIYNDLESQRIALGLGEFDNSVPEDIQEYIRLLANQMNGGSTSS